MRIRITANNPHLRKFYLQISAGEIEISYGYRTYVTMPTIELEPISTILPDLGEKLA